MAEELKSGLEPPLAVYLGAPTASSKLVFGKRAHARSFLQWL